MSENEASAQEDFRPFTQKIPEILQLFPERFVIMKATLSPVEGYEMFRSCSCCVISIRFCKILTMLLPAHRIIDFPAVAGRFLNNESIKQKSLISARVIKRTAGIS